MEALNSGVIQESKEGDGQGVSKESVKLDQEMTD